MLDTTPPPPPPPSPALELERCPACGTLGCPQTPELCLMPPADDERTEPGVDLEWWRDG